MYGRFRVSDGPVWCLIDSTDRESNYLPTARKEVDA
jgi:hypothetical protein